MFTKQFRRTNSKFYTTRRSNFDYLAGAPGRAMLFPCRLRGCFMATSNISVTELALGIHHRRWSQQFSWKAMNNEKQISCRSRKIISYCHRIFFPFYLQKKGVEILMLTVNCTHIRVLEGGTTSLRLVNLPMPVHYLRSAAIITFLPFIPLYAPL